MEKYNELLKYFRVSNKENDTLHTNCSVSMDNIHNAIIKVGVDMTKPLNYYTVVAKQNAINDYNMTNRRFRLLVENFQFNLSVNMEYDNIFEYDFNDNQLDLIFELLNGTKRYKSKFARVKYDKILQSIKDKINATL